MTFVTPRDTEILFLKQLPSDKGLENTNRRVLCMTDNEKYQKRSWTGTWVVTPLLLMGLKSFIDFYQ